MTGFTGKSKIHRLAAVVLLVMLVSALFGGAASAQTIQTTTTTRTGEQEFTGTVTELTSATMTLQLETQLRTFNIQRAEFSSAIAIGDTVKVHARLTRTGVWVAREVELSDPALDSVDDRGGHGADDPAGDDHGGHGADDPAGDDHGGDSSEHGGHGADDGSGHR